MTINFALRATYHVHRADPNDSEDDVVECLMTEFLCDSPNGLSLSDLACDVDEEIFGLLAEPRRPINHLPTGIHVVWFVGTATFCAGTNYEYDDGGEWIFNRRIEQWSPASLLEIEEAERASGADLSEFKPKETFL